MDIKAMDGDSVLVRVDVNYSASVKYNHEATLILKTRQAKNESETNLFSLLTVTLTSVMMT